MSFYIIDIINFILLFLLMDFVNGINNNYLGKKLQSGILAALLMLFLDLCVCFATSFWMASKIALLAIEIIAVIFIVYSKTTVKRLIRYEDVEEGKEEFFSSQRVMILVPHEDDDINLMGGVIEEYVKHASDVFVVFSTNGDGDTRFDMSQMGYTRIKEAIKVLTFLGVPEKNIIFLGYCDGGWGQKGYHIYNAPNDEVICSVSDRKATFGIDSHPAYHENKSYTRANLFADIAQVILDIYPDTIFCIDYDTHNDHRALSMMFERAIHDIITDSEYRPRIYKAFAYKTAWRAADDFYDSISISSSVNSFTERDILLYDWNNRIRLPIDINSVSRCLKRSKLYQALSFYSSQSANERAGRIINGDKVFWERRTDSLLYHADISVSSGDKNKLTDFMLLDCDDLINNGDHPYDGVWRPDADDPDKKISISFDEPTYVDHFVLYDSPSPVDNIINAIIELDDGTCVLTGKLDSYGTSVSIKKQIKSFSVRIVDYEGGLCGLSELEAFANEEKADRPLYKIIDNNDNFVYDYIIGSNGKQTFGLYTNTNCSTNAEDYQWKISNIRCKIESVGKECIINCPRGQKCLLSLLDKDNKVLDTVLIRNPRKLSRFLFEYCKDKNIHKTYVHRVYRKLTIIRKA